MINYDTYKTQISLPDFLRDVYGFKKDEGASQNYPKLKRNETGEVLVIKKNHKGHYTYFDIHNDDIKGKTILDYVQKQLSLDKFEFEGKLVSLPEVARYLDTYIDTGKFISPENSSFALNNESLSKDYITKALLDLKPFHDHSFLLKRGISVETFDNVLFKGVIFNKGYIDPNTKTVHVNTAFKMWSQNGVIAISQRNDTFKGCLGAKSESICISNYDSSKAIDAIYIGESFIDCMSHFQLNKSQLIGKNIVYISSEGNLVDGQIAVIQKIISVNSPKEVFSIFDNDLAGHYYTAKLFGKISVTDKMVNFSQDGNQAPNHFKELSIDVVKGKIMSHLEIYILKDEDPILKRKLIDEAFGQQNLKIQHLLKKDPFKIDYLYEKEGLIKLIISFETSSETWNAAAQTIISIKFNNLNCVKRDIPLLSDFNDDLRTLL